MNSSMCKIKKWMAAYIAAVMLVSGLMPPDTARALTIREEEDLSQEFLKAVFDAYDVIRDPVINDYINTVGHKLIFAMPPQPFDYKFYAVRQDAYNAFAGPGGNIFVFSGLFNALENEDELAALLAHEIAHVSCRHISEMMKKSKTTSMATMAGVVAGILIGLGGAGTVGSALTIGSMAAGQSMALAYSREHEMQADQIGRTYLQKAGYSLHGLLSILKKIRSVDWFNTDEIPTYLRTHPATEERILYLDNLLENQDAPPPQINDAFSKAHTRMMALYGDADTALRRFKIQVEKNPDNAMARYGYGLALIRAGNLKAARDQLAIAREKKPDDPDFAIDYGIACFQAGGYAEALDIFENAAPSAANARIAKMYLGRTFLALDRNEAAAGIFAAIIHDDPENADAYFYLGKAEGKMDNLASAHYNLGQSDLKNKNPQNAKFHFTKALEYEKDPARIEKIRQMLKDMEKPRRFFGRDDTPDSQTDQKTEPSGGSKWHPLRFRPLPY